MGGPLLSTPLNQGLTIEVRSLLGMTLSYYRITEKPGQGSPVTDQPRDCLGRMARGLQMRYLNLVLTIKTEPSDDSLRTHPAFQTLLGKMNS